ncbi:hypothetical protein F5X97DRAFT_329404, partial [Nemania serpens]
MASNVARAEVLKNASNIAAILSQGSNETISEEARVQALQAATRLVHALEKPEDGLIKLAWSPSIWMALRVCVQLDVFSMIMNNEVVSAGEIANKRNADEALIRRLIRGLTAAGYVTEKGDGLYGANHWTAHISSRRGQSTMNFVYDTTMLPIAQAADWFKETGYQNPVDPRRGMLQAAHHTDLPIFAWLAAPENKELWDNANKGHAQKTPLLVDVAGGRGQELMEFVAKYPDEAGPFVLQDQQAVLDSATSLSAKIEKRAINFSTESPVK